MLKRVLLILAFILAGCGSELEPPHEMELPPVGPIEVTGGSELPGTALPLQYYEAYEITEQEWVAAGLDYPIECVQRRDTARLIRAGWDDFEAACGGEAYSRHKYEMHDAHRSVLGCTIFDRSLGVQLITIDAGMTLFRKLSTMMHEAIHALGSCAENFSDAQHEDDYRWDFILDKAEDRVSCNSAALGDLVENRSAPYCILGKFPQ